MERGKGSTCTAGNFIVTLDATQTAAIEAAVAEGITLSAIGRWLRSLGFTGSEEAATRHLGKRCKCPQS